MAHRGRQNADDLLAAALAAGKTAREAATSAGVAERTVFRRLADDPFRRRVSELRAAMLGAAAAGRLADTMTSAADLLRGLLADPDPDVRHRAAVKVIELGAKLGELTDLERRIAGLEAATDSQKGVTDGP
ncbi:hypothetical protein [Urbifossiella limnaea]|uniref:Uncharacterized protein n=1 Tax=Urbifossiella limnaea TaxID=2528023 RepID=A0A517XQE8_9BACT|nr:hypothetical protein [Urbifossiella limnaea]QDU19731.1 hypothetical protein ETAA1_16670 [Urbifossiella limnaea]